MREQRERAGVILFWLLMLCTFLISVFRKQRTTSVPSPNRTASEPATRAPQHPHPGTSAHLEPAVDSGMIEVALVIATVGFLLYQFGDELDVAPPIPFTDVTMKQIGKVVVFVGIAAAFLLHSTYWLTWVQQFNRRTGRLNRVTIPALLAHTIIFSVLGAATAISAYFAGGNCCLSLAAIVTVILALMAHRKS